MAELLEESSQLESTTVKVGRTSSTVAGGRRFSFGALVIIGDRQGRVGFGYAKSNEVPAAIEKAQKVGRRALTTIPMTGRTIPHQVEGRYSASRVRLVPASPGTGVVAGGTVRAILEMAGITDCLTKCYGSTNTFNSVKATFDAISQLRLPAHVASARGVEIGQTEIEIKIERGKAHMPAATTREKARGPVNTVGDGRGRGGRGGQRGGGGRGGPRGGGGGGGGGDNRGGGGGGGDRGGPAPAAPAAAPESAPPAGGTPS
jgi:small subunit ribosomal protein S5